MTTRTKEAITATMQKMQEISTALEATFEAMTQQWRNEARQGRASLAATELETACYAIGAVMERARNTANMLQLIDMRANHEA